MAGDQLEHAQVGRAAFVDWPTLALIVAFWAGFLVLTIGHSGVPTVGLLAGLAILGGLYMSLQHEAIHGHPTSSARLNHVLVAAPLGMIQPFGRYRTTHLRHHDSDLTDPVSDPESYYVLPVTWEHAGPVRRLVLQANRTLAFRLTVGPVLAVIRTVSYDIRHARRDHDIAITWSLHLVGCAVIIAALRFVGMPLWIYVVGFVFGGGSFTALRSFVEHRATAQPRSAIVHTGWFFSVLYLNNNLHYTHHQLPGAAWYRLPELTNALDADRVVADGAGSYESYRTIFRLYFLHPFDEPVTPLSAKMEV